MDGKKLGCVDGRELGCWSVGCAEGSVEGRFEGLLEGNTVGTNGGGYTKDSFEKVTFTALKLAKQAA